MDFVGLLQDSIMTIKGQSPDLYLPFHLISTGVGLCGIDIVRHNCGFVGFIARIIMTLKGQYRGGESLTTSGEGDKTGCRHVS